MPLQEYMDVLQDRTSPRTAEVYRRNLSAFFSWLVQRKYLKRNAFSSLEVRQTSPRAPASFEPAELLHIFRVSDRKWKAIVTLALCGLRRSEVLNLCRGDVDLVNGQILIAPKADSLSTWEWENGNLERLVQLPRTIDWGYFHIRPQYEIEGLLDLVPSGQPYVCLKPRQYSRILQKRADGYFSFEDSNCPWCSFSRDFGLLLKKAKVEHKRFDDLRTTYAAILARTNVRIEAAQELMRHRSKLTTYSLYRRQRLTVDNG